MKRLLLSSAFIALLFMLGQTAQAQEVCHEVAIEASTEKALPTTALPTSHPRQTYNMLKAAGLLSQPYCCWQWDQADEATKLNVKHVHGKKGPMAGIPVQTLTDPNHSTSNEHCKGKPCMPASSKLVKEGKATACRTDGTHCERKCGDKSELSTCGRFCCEEECGCGDCP